MIGRWAAAAALLVALAAAPAVAQPIDLSSGGPVEITAVGGFEWNENDRTVSATGGARAVRGDVTVLADKLVAYYRKKPGAAQPSAASSGSPESGDNEVYRLEAIGNVRILTQTDEATGDKAVYDIDQALLVMTGKNLRLTTGQFVLTARDDFEYWSQRRMAVGRGNAVVVANDGRRLAADVLVAYLTPSGEKKTASAAPAKEGDSGKGKLERIEAFGNVEVRTTSGDIVRGERGVYLPDPGLARVLGNVKIIHGQNVITGAAADLDMNAGVAHVVANPNARVEGLIMPNDTQPKPATSAPARSAR